MKKRGKYERQPVAAAPKQPKVKNLLLQTYITSLICMLLCVTMFFGTSFAWFSSEVTNQGNEIYIGTLDVGLYKAGGLDLAKAENKLFDKDVRWEPGFTAVETIEVVNKGDLAFKYVLSFTDGMLNGAVDPELANVAKYFDVWVYDFYDNGQIAPVYTSYEDISTANKWYYIGTLAEVLAGKAVITGNMNTVRYENRDPAAPTVEGTTDGVPTTDTYTIALHMREDATTEVVGYKISLSVKLVAYQKGEEQDDFQDNRYDMLVYTAADLKDALEKGGNITLMNDIDLSKTQVAVPSDITAVLNLNGYDITAKVDKTGTLITNNGTLTINGKLNAEGVETSSIDLIFNGPAVGYSAAVNTISNRGVLIVNGGKITNTSTITDNQTGYAIDNYPGASLTVNGGEITASGNNWYDGIRLFCNSNSDNLVTVNGGKISSIWAQNPSNGKATAVKGVVVINGGEIITVYYENYTIVKVKEGLSLVPVAYGEGKENTQSEVADGYTVYSFKH